MREINLAERAFVVWGPDTFKNSSTQKHGYSLSLVRKIITSGIYSEQEEPYLLMLSNAFEESIKVARATKDKKDYKIAKELGITLFEEANLANIVPRKGVALGKVA